MYAEPKYTGMETMNPARFRASISFFLPNTLRSPFAISSMPPESPSIIPKMPPKRISSPMLVMMLPNPLVRYPVVSVRGIPHKIPMSTAHTNRATPALTLNTISDISRIAMVITKANKTFIYYPPFSHTLSSFPRYAL